VEQAGIDRERAVKEYIQHKGSHPDAERLLCGVCRRHNTIVDIVRPLVFGLG
jgi:hypothetical protein